MQALLLRDESELLRDARLDVEAHGYITGLVSARLTAWGHDVAKLESRLLTAVWR